MTKFFGIDGSDNATLRTISDRLDLGPNGPKAIIQVGMAVLMIGYWLIANPRFWDTSGSGWIAFAPLLFLAFIIFVVVRTLRSARADIEEGWRD